MSNARNLANVLGTSTTIPTDKLPTGGVVQVKHAESNTVSSHTSSFSDTNLTVSITPTSASNKILIHISFIYGHTDSTAVDCRVEKVIGSTTTYLHFDEDDGGPRSTLGNIRAVQNVGQGFHGFSTIIEDSPATTSQVTYTLQGQADLGTLYINNRNDNNPVTDRLGHITITEIAG
mgnify:CR=1 FL=1